MTVDVRISGLDKLAEAIAALAEAIQVPQARGMKKEHDCETTQGVVEQQGKGALEQESAVKSNFPEEQAQTNSIAGQQMVTPVNHQMSVDVSAPRYTLNDLATAAMMLMDSGRQAELQQLLAAFGVESLPALPEEQYGAFATALREKGAQI